MKIHTTSSPRFGSTVVQLNHQTPPQETLINSQTLLCLDVTDEPRDKTNQISQVGALFQRVTFLLQQFRNGESFLMVGTSSEATSGAYGFVDLQYPDTFAQLKEILEKAPVLNEVKTPLIQQLQAKHQPEASTNPWGSKLSLT